MQGKEKSERESELKPGIGFEAAEGEELTADAMAAVARLVAEIIHAEIKARHKNGSQQSELQQLGESQQQEDQK